MSPIADKNDLLSIVKKFADGNASPEEIRFLEKYYDAIDHSGKDQYSLSEEEMNLIKNEMKSHLFADLTPGKNKIRHMKRVYWLRTAAAVVSILGMMGAAYLLKKSNSKESAPVTVPAQSYGDAVSYTRSLRLPDGSTALLREGSSIEFNDSFADLRELKLKGEGYFDIVFDDQRPFVVQTGKVKTTVLGTAFNVKAYPGEDNITVSVTRGKVKMEDPEKVIAVISPDQQVIYEVSSAGFKQETIDATALVTDWAREEMLFESLPFEEIATILTKRYGIDIHFADEGLKYCPINTEFSGTETLTDVLDSLCSIIGSHYSIEGDGSILLYGQPCKNTNEQ